MSVPIKCCRRIHHTFVHVREGKPRDDVPCGRMTGDAKPVRSLFSCRNLRYSVSNICTECQNSLTLRFEMQILTNPLIWLRRIRHRCGYGVHSPFAFGFLMQVVYERNAFYAFQELDRSLAWWQRFRVRRTLHMLFRLANYVRPQRIIVPHSPLVARYMQAACPNVRTDDLENELSPVLMYLQKPLDESYTPLRHMGVNDVLVLDNLPRHRAWFAALPATVTFDLYDIGIAFFNPKLNEQHYIINF